jgi:hypothetical protein
MAFVSVVVIFALAAFATENAMASESASRETVVLIVFIIIPVLTAIRN